MKFKLLLFLSLTVTIACSQDQTKKIAESPAAKEDFKDDWANLSKYEKENAALGQPKPGERRVVFLGSSVFEFWKQKDPEYFAGKAYLNRGVAGQISPQLLLRFRADVIDVKAKAVIILAGSNDIAANTGHITNARIMDNVKSMVELAKANKISVILCAYLPIIDYPWRKGIEPADKIIALNKLIRAYAAEEKLVLLDYFTPFVNEVNGQKAELTTDGVHPNLKGYKIMEGITDEAIAKALRL